VSGGTGDTESRDAQAQGTAQNVRAQLPANPAMLFGTRLDAQLFILAGVENLLDAASIVRLVTATYSETAFSVLPDWTEKALQTQLSAAALLNSLLNNCSWGGGQKQWLPSLTQHIWEVSDAPFLKAFGIHSIFSTGKCKMNPVPMSPFQ